MLPDVQLEYKTKGENMKKTMFAALVTLAAGAACAEIGDWRVPNWDPVLSAPESIHRSLGTWCGHVQGMCVTSNAMYFSLHNQIVKTDWYGRFIKRAQVTPHGGDICHWNGRLYTGVWEPPKKKGEKGCTSIKVYDAETLEQINERRMPDWQNAADGITCLDGTIILAMGMGDWGGNGHENYYGKFDANTLEPIGKPFLVRHGEQSSHGAQNLTTDGKYIYAAYYTSDEAAKTPNFVVFDKDFKVVSKHNFGWTHGVDTIPGGRDGAVRFAWCTTINWNWKHQKTVDTDKQVYVQALVQFAELKDGKIENISRVNMFKKPLNR
jgi:hypothetical protein